MVLVFILLFVFWVSPFVMLLYSGWWAAYIWQINRFSWENIKEVLAWEFSEEHRNQVKTILKVNFLIFSLSGLLLPGNILSYIGIFGFQAIWFNNCLLVGEKILGKKLPQLNLNSRSLINLLTYLGILTLIITVITSLVFTAEISGTTDISLTAADLNSSSIYSFILISAIAAGILELGGIFSLAFIDRLTTPFQQIHLSVLRQQTKMKLSAYGEVKKIIVVGDHHTRFTARLIKELLGESYSNFVSPLAIDSSVEYYNFIQLLPTNPSKVALIIEVNDWATTHINPIVQDIDPNIIVFTGVDEASAVFYGSYEALIEHKTAMINRLKSNGTVILNLDDPDLIQVAGKVNFKEVYVYKDSSDYAKLKDKDLEIENVCVERADYDDLRKETIIGLRFSNSALPLHLLGKHPQVAIPVAMGVAAALELGIEASTIAQTTPYLNLDEHLATHYPINNGSIILRSHERTNLISLKRDLEHLDEIAKGDKYLVTKGLPNYSRYSGNIYARLAKLIAPHIQVLITYDVQFAQAVQKNYPKVDIALVSDYKQAALEVSKRLEPDDTLLINSEIDLNLIRFFVDS